MSESSIESITTPQEALTAALDKWVAATEELGHSSANPPGVRSVDLQTGSGQKLTLERPGNDVLYSAADQHPTMGYCNTVRARLADTGSRSTLYVDTDIMPRVLTSTEEGLVLPALRGREFMRLLLDAKVINPAHK